MPPGRIFQIDLVLGYVAWLLCFGAYLLPWLKSMPRIEAHRFMATLHSFRFVGLVFVLPGVVGPGLPGEFGKFAAYGDLATALLAILALLTIRIRPLFWVLVVAFNLAGVVDFLGDYYLAMRSGVPMQAGQLGSAYFIPIVYVPVLMIMHFLAFYWIVRPHQKVASDFASDANGA